VQVSVTGRHIDITDGLREHIYRKLQRELDDFPRITSVHVIVTVERHRHIAEVVIQAPPHIRVEASADTENLYLAIDEAIEKAARQIRRQMEKLHDYRTR